MLFIQYFVNILVHRLPKGIIEKLCSIAPLILQSYSEYNIFVLTYTLKLVSSLAQLCTFFTFFSLIASGMHGAVREERSNLDSASLIREQRIHSAHVRVFHRHSEPVRDGRFPVSPFLHCRATSRQADQRDRLHADPEHHSALRAASEHGSDAQPHRGALLHLSASSLRQSPRRNDPPARHRGRSAASLPLRVSLQALLSPRR